MPTFSLIGYGNRGMTYAAILTEMGERVLAVCDENEEKRANAAALCGLEASALYADEDAFFAAGKLSDILIIATWDRFHIRQAIRALTLGYDLILEKPIARSAEECREIEETAERLGRRVFVCHVLRYAPFFSVLKKELDTGKYGRISTINLTENVGYEHQAHSYVRGNTRREDLATPMLISKCCHDLDLISWFVNDKCTAVSSFGSLRYFTPENAPEGAAERCMFCDLQDSCAYSAKKHYVQKIIERGKPNWACHVVMPNATAETMAKELETSRWGICAFKLDNDVVDHQVVNMLFANGTTAHLTMTAFSDKCYREIHLHGEQGEIYGNMMENVLHCRIFGGESYDIDLNDEINAVSGYHGGGDYHLLRSVLECYEGKENPNVTTLAVSMQSHYIGFAAERSRHTGETVKL
ncbi:MAG: Gfo/Idh/MocA family oxidoreductase [Ruminococcaceae bacterium]|nr:Gfo/Idh/MocA family oxidoreductase [Oscillospiraceae bacterium]